LIGKGKNGAWPHFYYPNRIEAREKKAPATAPVIRQASVAARRALKPNRERSFNRSGTKPPIPPTKIASDAM
jgi:hypothetical protein